MINLRIRRRAETFAEDEACFVDAEDLASGDVITAIRQGTSPMGVPIRRNARSAVRYTNSRIAPSLRT